MEADDVSYSLSQDKEEGEETLHPENVFQKTETEQKTSGFTSASPLDEEDSPLGFLPKKLLSLIIGILVIALFVPFLMYSLSHRTKSSNTKTASVSTSTNQAKITPTAAPKAAQKSQTKTNQKVAQKTNAKPTIAPVGNTTKGGLPVTNIPSNNVVSKGYTDPVFGYSLKMPQGWEVYRNAGGGTAYQMAFHPAGSPDVPLLIGAQGNTSETEWINTEYGANYPRENSSVNGKPALLIRTANYVSYYTHDNTYTYEISEALGKDEYTPIYQNILASLTFSK